MNGTAGRAWGTREAILAILRRRSRVPVEDFAAELDLAGATVRRHLDVLRRDGAVSVDQDRGGAGRPRYVFSLTERGADGAPRHSVRLTRRLVEEIVGLDPADTTGHDGEAVAEIVFRRMSDRLLDRYRPQIDAPDVPARARQLVLLLAEEGFDFEVVEEPGALTLLGRGCPCRRVEAGAYGCEHDRVLFERLLGAPVTAVSAGERPSTFLGGYRVRVAPAGDAGR